MLIIMLQYCILVDDGTGEIDCWHDSRNIIKHERGAGRLDKLLDMAIAEKLDESMSAEPSSSSIDVSVIILINSILLNYIC